MNPKVFVFAAVLVIIGILGAIVLVGPDMQTPGQGNNNSVENAPTIELLEVELADLSVTKINERSATIEIAFEIFNPNPRAVIVQTMDYNLFETGFSSYEQLAGGTIGSRPEGMVEFGSNYYTLLGENSIVLKKKMVIKILPLLVNYGIHWNLNMRMVNPVVQNGGFMEQFTLI